MHRNAALLDKLFTALGAHDPLTMTSCYHPRAHFRDIAFDLRGTDDIYKMWRMVCSTDAALQVKVESVEADDRTGRAKLVETYRFGAGDRPPGRRVTNHIKSRFRFRGGQIWDHLDDCDAKLWATQAMGEGIKGFLAGRVRLIRSLGAQRKLDKFLEENP